MVSEEEKRTIKLLSEEGFKQARLAAPARAVMGDIQACLDSGADIIPIFIAPSRLRLEYQLRMTLDEAIAQAVKQHHAKQDKKDILKRFDECKSEFSHLKADLSEEELLAIARPILQGKK